ncbi:hypothetical protein ACYOEI_11420 [Singulisphaera rosea]
MVFQIQNAQNRESKALHSQTRRADLRRQQGEE